MCLAKVFLGQKENENLILEDVAYVGVEGKTLQLVTLFGERKEISAKLLKEIDFQNSRIILEKSDQ